MATKKSHLGRGLSALLGETSEAAAPSGNLRRAPIEKLHPGRFQPRRHFAPQALDDLAQSIRAQGVLQPILVRTHPDRPGEFEIVAGERRWRAAQIAALHEVPIVERALDDRAVLEIALIENVQRQDLSPVEEAEGYRRLIDEFDYTQEALAKAIGRSRPAIANLLRLLDLPPPVKAMLADGRLSEGHARALLTAPNPFALAEEVLRLGLNVRQTEALARRAKSPNRGRVGGKSGRAKDADTRALERDLTLALGLKVEIDFDGKGGRLVLHYKSLDQLDRLIADLRRGR